MAVTPERTLLVSVGEWPLHIAVINFKPPPGSRSGLKYMLGLLESSIRAGLAINDSSVFRKRLENEHGSLKSNPIFLRTFLMENRKNVFWFFRYNGLNFKPLDLGVAVRTGLGTKRQSLPLAGVAIGKFNRGADQSSGSGGFLLLKFSCLEFF